MSKGIRGLFRGKTDEEKAALKAKLEAEAVKNEICARQSAFMAAEVKLEWRIVFGNTLPKKKKDTFLITDVTRRNVWMEPNFLYNQIVAFEPNEFFHPPDKYALKWQPTGSLFQLVIPLHDPMIQENAIIIMSHMNPIEQANTIFFFAPVDPAMPMFAPKVHPSSLVSYRTKNQCLKKLCDCFLEDKVSVSEIQAILMCDPFVWKAALYNLLAEDEQVYHQYLLDNKPLTEVRRTIAKSYLDGEITLEQYEDMKFPERKRLKEIEEMEYPLPFEKDVCAICGRENCGIVKCQTCTNMVCKNCMHSIFSGKTGRKSISFLLMHQKYCMKLGELSKISVVVPDEPAYLREFRRTSRKAALAKLIPVKPPVFFQEDELSEDEEELERKRLAELERIRLEEEEAARLARENPESLQILVELFDKCAKKLERLGKDIREYVDKITDKSRTDQYIARNERLRAEAIERMQSTIREPVERIVEQATLLNLTGEFIDDLLLRSEQALKEVQFLSMDITPASAPASRPVSAAAVDDSTTGMEAGGAAAAGLNSSPDHLSSSSSSPAAAAAADGDNDDNGGDGDSAAHQISSQLQSMESYDAESVATANSAVAGVSEATAVDTRTAAAAAAAADGDSSDVVADARITN